MKAITIKQPWATLIAIGAKKLETRSWQTHYRGPIAIHAGKKIEKEALSDPWIKRTLEAYKVNHLPTGCVIATGQLTNCNKISLGLIQDDLDITGLEIKLGDFSDGRYAWKILIKDKFKNPIPAKGQLSLWEWEEKQ